MTIDPCIPTMPGRSTEGFHRAGRHRMYQARTVKCSASRMKGELRPTKNRVRGGRSHMDDSVKCIDLLSGVATSRDSDAGGGG